MSADRLATAYHEAGHAVIGRVLGLACGSVQIGSGNEDELGYAIVEDPMHTWERGDGPRRLQIEAHCISLYAGAEAERILLGSKEVGDGPDCEKARSCLCEIGVRRAQFVGDDVWEGYEDRLRNRARQLILLHRAKIERVAAALTSQGRLTDDDVQALMALRPPLEPRRLTR